MWKREKVWSWQQSRREVEAWTKRSRRLESAKTSCERHGAIKGSRLVDVAQETLNLAFLHY